MYGSTLSVIFSEVGFYRNAKKTAWPQGLFPPSLSPLSNSAQAEGSNSQTIKICLLTTPSLSGQGWNYLFYILRRMELTLQRQCGANAILYMFNIKLPSTVGGC